MFFIIFAVPPGNHVTSAVFGTFTQPEEKRGVKIFSCFYTENQKSIDRFISEYVSAVMG